MGMGTGTFKWVASRVSGALVAVCGTACGGSSFVYRSPALPMTWFNVRGTLHGADAVALRVVVEEVSVFRITAGIRSLERLFFTVTAAFRKTVRRIRRVLRNDFRNVQHFNLRHLYRRERRLRL